MIGFKKHLSLEEAIQILDSYLRNATDNGDDVSIEQDALARITDELSDWDTCLEGTK